MRDILQSTQNLCPTFPNRLGWTPPCSSVEWGCTPRYELGWCSCSAALALFFNFIFIFNFFVLFLASSHSYSADQVRVWDTEEVSGSVRAHDDVAAARERPALRTVISDFAAWLCLVLPKLFPCTEMCSHGKWSMLLRGWTTLHNAERCTRASCESLGSFDSAVC